MSTYGYIRCKECKGIIFLGKWLSDKLGFHHGKLTIEGNNSLQGDKVLKFIAFHHKS